MLIAAFLSVKSPIESLCIPSRSHWRVPTDSQGLHRFSYVTAFPGVVNYDSLQKRAESAPREPQFLINRPNTGLPASGFSATDQYVDVTDGGEHRFIAPTGSDIRGQCPGLNAAANHGFLNRNGPTTITQAIEGLGQAYNMAPDLAGFLAVVAVGLSGDPLTQTWSHAHNIPEVLADLAVNNAAFPGTIRFGGNIGTVNSFTGVDTADITGGVLNSATLFEGNNLACFFLQASLAGLPDAAAPALGAIGSVLNFVTSKVAPLQAQLACPQLGKFNNDLFNQFPGANA